MRASREVHSPKTGDYIDRRDEMIADAHSLNVRCLMHIMKRDSSQCALCVREFIAIRKPPIENVYLVNGVGVSVQYR